MVEITTGPLQIGDRIIAQSDGNKFTVIEVTYTLAIAMRDDDHITEYRWRRNMLNDEIDPMELGTLALKTVGIEPQEYKVYREVKE